MSANRESQTWWDSVIDRPYCPYAIDQVVLGMRAHRGERLDVVEKALGELIAACEPRTVQELER